MLQEYQTLNEAVMLTQDEGKLLTFPGARIRIKVFYARPGRVGLIR